MSTCHVCNEPTSEENYIRCASENCLHVFHYACAGLSQRNYKKIKDKLTWICAACSQQVLPKVSHDDAALRKLITEQNTELKSIMTSQFKELTKSIEFNCSIIKDLKETIADLKTQNNILKSENSAMKNQLQELKHDVIELKQYTRRVNIEIANLPEADQENLTEVISTLQEIAGINMNDSVSIIHRVPSFNKEKPKPIICQFKSKPLRDIFLKKLRNCKLTAKQVNPRFPDSPIFFNEHLAPELKQLFFQARKFKTEHQFRFCWTRDGKIFLRKDESSKITRIKSIDDLNAQFTT